MKSQCSDKKSNLTFDSKCSDIYKKGYYSNVKVEQDEKLFSVFDYTGQNNVPVFKIYSSPDGLILEVPQELNGHFFEVSYIHP